MVLKEDGGIVAWGRNDYGQCEVPEGLTDVLKITTGATHTLAIKSDGTVVAWGDNRFEKCNVPEGLTDVIDIAAGETTR